jgi:thiosulfate/3-mercaptopyruvate sulfurtransferase
VAGHIPGAVSAPTTGNVNPDGTFKDPAELAARFSGLGAVSGAAVGAYCGSGVTAAHEVLALALAGLPAALYVGSWSNWISDPARPVATGGCVICVALPRRRGSACGGGYGATGSPPAARRSR